MNSFENNRMLSSVIAAATFALAGCTAAATDTGALQNTYNQRLFEATNGMPAQRPFKDPEIRVATMMPLEDLIAQGCEYTGGVIEIRETFGSTVTAELTGFQDCPDDITAAFYFATENPSFVLTKAGIPVLHTALDNGPFYLSGRVTANIFKFTPEENKPTYMFPFSPSIRADDVTATLAKPTILGLQSPTRCQPNSRWTRIHYNRQGAPTSTSITLLSDNCHEKKTLDATQTYDCSAPVFGLENGLPTLIDCKERE